MIKAGHLPKAGRDFKLSLPSKMEALSWSQIETYMNCSRRYYYERVLGLTAPPNVWFAEGKLFAKVLEAYFKALLKDEHLNHHELMVIHSGNFDKEFSGVVLTKEEQTEIGQRASKFLSTLLDPKEKWNFRPSMIHLKGMKEPLPGVEYEFTVKIAGVPVTGIIDLVEDTCLIDFKVAASSQYYNPEKSLQLALYNTVVSRPRVGFIVCEKKSGRVIPLIEDFDPKRVKQVEAIVRCAAAGISSKCWLPNPTSKWCSAKWCPHWEICDGHS